MLGHGPCYSAEQVKTRNTQRTRTSYERRGQLWKNPQQVINGLGFKRAGQGCSREHGSKRHVRSRLETIKELLCSIAGRPGDMDDNRFNISAMNDHVHNRTASEKCEDAKTAGELKRARQQAGRSVDQLAGGPKDHVGDDVARTGRRHQRMHAGIQKLMRVKRPVVVSWYLDSNRCGCTAWMSHHC